MPIKFDIASFSSEGPRRENEDAILILDSSDDFVLVAVADGLGGMGAGKEASTCAVQYLKDHAARISFAPNLFGEVALEIHRAILSRQQAGSDNARMATTLTAALIADGHLVGVHVGDTRFAISRGSGIKRLTTDHSEGQRLFEAGALTKEQFLGYSRNNILESALGGDGKLRVDSFNFEFEKGDVFVITSDGVHTKILLREMKSLIMQSRDAPSLVNLVSTVVESRHPDDNYSVIAGYAI